ncbi:lipoate--protein ligase family protein [Pseudonocardia sp. GCM10023141]|uniref:lipoate--protein ligase family protein n=1 Tax=Pseudonocardia sp. GCM10023141 TaxID=3252653 RepID=UPI0036169095
MLLIRGSVPGSGPAFDVALAGHLLRCAGREGPAAVLRVSRPARPTVAFSRRDTLAPGFPAAAQAARSAGFEPVVRAPGGRAVAFTGCALVLDHISTDADALSGLDARFRDFGALWAAALQTLGIDARVGEVPGEYCPGAHSVNAGGTAKLVGTAQRVVKGAWLFSAVAVLDDAAVLAPLLTDIYRHLDMPFDSGSVGAIGHPVEQVEAAVLAQYAALFELVPGELDAAVLDGVGLADHRVPA